MIINTQTVKKSSGGNNNYAVNGRILDDNELIYPSIKTPEGTVVVPSNNPADYTKVDWLQCTGTQAIDCLFYPNNNTRFVADFEIVQRRDWNNLFGTYGGQSGSNKFFFFAERGAENYYYGGYRTTADMPTASTAIGRHSLDMNKRVFTYDGNSYTFSSGTFSSEYSFVLLGASTYNGAIGYSLNTKLYSASLYDNDVLYRNFIPCYHTASGIRGVFDSVHNLFLQNAGTGEFLIPSDTSGEINLAEYLASLT